MNTTITLVEALNLIENATAVIVNNDALMYASTSELTGDGDNEFLYLGWTDGDGYDYRIKAIESNNQTVEVSDKGGLVFVDDEGEPFELTLLSVSPVKKA